MITVYTSEHCPQCKATKRLLNNEELSYIEIEVNDSNIDEVKKFGFLSLPIVVTDTDKWQGFRPDKIKEIKR